MNPRRAPRIFRDRPLSAILLMLGAVLTQATPARGQYDYLLQYGFPHWSATEPVEQGFVNLANGNLHLEIPVYSAKQRGTIPDSIQLTYDSRIWRVLTTSSSVWQSGNVGGSQGGWSLRQPNSTYFAYDTVIGGTCVSGSTSYNWYKYQNFRIAQPGYQDNGAITRFAVYSESNPPCHTPTVTASGPSIDIPGYWMTLIGNGPAVSAVLGPDGTKLYGTAGSSGCSSAVIRDRNGNCIDMYDTLGRNPVGQTGYPNQTVYSVLNSEGGASTVTVNYTTVYVKTAFGQAGVTEYQGSFKAIGSIVLPDSTQYTFTYDTGTSPSDPTIHYGLLTSMTLPSGGTINFTHSKFTDANGKVNLWVTERQQNITGGGTWSYTQATCGTNCNKVTVTRPSGSPSNEQSVYTFTLNNGAWNTLAEHYRGSVSGTPPHRNEKSYDTSIPDPVSGTASAFIQLITSTSTEASTSGYLVRKIEHDHDTFGYTYNGVSKTGSRGNTEEIREYAYGSGVPGSLLRKKVMTYLNDCPSGPYCTRNIVSLLTIVQVKDAGGAKKSESSYIYDSTSLISATGITHHDDTNFGTSFTTRGNSTVVTDWVGGSTYRTTTYTYDMTGQLRQTTDPKGQTTSFSYADNFFNDSDPVTDPPPTYSPSTPTNAYLTQVTLPVAATRAFGYYWGTGKPAYSQDQNGQRSYSHYTDSLDRLDYENNVQGGTSVSVVRKVYASGIQHNLYRAAGTTPASPSCSSCRKEQVTLDGLGRPQTRTVLNDPQGPAVSDTIYDAAGRVQGVTNPYRGTPGGSEIYDYDFLNRRTLVAKVGGTAFTYYGDTVGPAGGRTSQLCSGTGFPVLNVDEAGRKRQTWLDALGRLVEADEPDGSGNLTLATCYSYDVLGNLIQVAQGSESRTYVYDALSRVISESVPESGTQYTYYMTTGGALCAGDPQAVCRHTDARNVTTTYTYDALNRPTGKTYSNGNSAVSYFYDQSSYNGLTITNGVGRRTGMSDGSGQTAWSFDEQGHVIAERRTIGTVTKTISYTYFLDGSLASITYPGGRVVNYTYNDIGQAESASDSITSYVNNAHYSASGALCSYKNGNSITSTLTFNDRLQPTRIHATTSGAPSTPCGAPSTNGNILDLSYSWQGAGSDNNDTVRTITNNIDTGRTQTYTYDSLNRLATAQTQATSGSNCWGLSYGYDRYSNLLTSTVTKCSAPSLNLSVNTQNRITNSGFAYDAAGNMTSDGTSTYTWNAESRLSTAAGVTYTYDGDGKRVKKSSGTLYWYSVEGDLLEQTNSTGGVPSDYVYFNGRRMARRDPLVPYYLFHDHLGSLRTITSANGSVVRNIDYYPFGTPFLNSGSTDDPNRFALLYLDSESGLYHSLNRKYSGTLGRWLSSDADPGRMSNPQSLDLYSYALDNPTNLVDPLGLSPSEPECSECPGLNPFNCPHFFPEPENQDPCPRWKGTRGNVPGDIPGFSRKIFKPGITYFRECICDMLTPVPLRLPFPRGRTKACAFECNCDDGSFGINLVNVKTLQEVCSPVADVICPFQIKTISVAILFDPLQVLSIHFPHVVACRFLSSSVWQ